jgi:hypothetical protein
MIDNAADESCAQFATLDASETTARVFDAVEVSLRNSAVQDLEQMHKRIYYSPY